MTKNQKDKIVIGRFGKTFGIHGWIKVNSFTQQPEDITKFTPWFISYDQIAWKEVTVTEREMKGENVMVRLPGIMTPESAQNYTNQYIAINREQLPELVNEEIYWADLIGMTVTNSNGIDFGKVVNLLATGSNDVLVVKKDVTSINSHSVARERYIPYLSSVIKKVDTDTGTLVVDWDEDF